MSALALRTALVFGLIVALTHPTHSADRPNVLCILADDLGYSDLGCYGSEIATPNLDGLARSGLRFTQFYNTARCWPSRAALLTGYYAQQVRRDKVPGVTSGGRGTRPTWAPLLPAMLRPLGYRTYHSGKWHLDGQPLQLQTGFDHSYLLQDQGRFFSPRTHFEDDVKQPAVQRGSGYYATTAIAEHAIRCLKEHAARYPQQPFFHYVAFTAPHFPLHALPDDIDRYREKYRAGWDQIREARWQRIKSMRLVAGDLSVPERDVGPPYHFPDALTTLGSGEINRPVPWSVLTDQQREFQATKMAIHAAMIDRMDREIGRILDQLRHMAVFENTLILFLSDNGASAEIMVRDDGHDPSAAPGSAATYLCLGPGWSTVANTPLRRHKTWVHEGGISTPLILHWPERITARGELRHSPGHVIDLLPTIMDIAGAPLNDQPPRNNSNSDNAPPRPGKSLVPVLAQDGTAPNRELWWLHEGNRAIRVGNWKLVAADDDSPWELFDLSTDRAETKNLATERPDKAKQLTDLWTTRWDAIRKLAARDQN